MMGGRLRGDTRQAPDPHDPRLPLCPACMTHRYDQDRRSLARYRAADPGELCGDLVHQERQAARMFDRAGVELRAGLAADRMMAGCFWVVVLAAALALVGWALGG